MVNSAASVDFAAKKNVKRARALMGKDVLDIKEEAKRVKLTSEESVEEKEYATGRWTAEEHTLFLSGLDKFGKHWRKIAKHIQTRNYVQTRTHAQKYFKKVAKERLNLGKEIPRELTSTANDGKQWKFDQKIELATSTLAPFKSLGPAKTLSQGPLATLAEASLSKSAFMSAPLMNPSSSLYLNLLAQQQLMNAAAALKQNSMFSTFMPSSQMTAMSPLLYTGLMNH